MRIDSHQHFWNYCPKEYDWIDNSMQVIAKDFLPADLKPHLENNNFDGCVAVQARCDVKENDYLLKLSDESPIVKGVVGWVDLAVSNLDEQLTPYKDHEKFVGIREILQGQEPGFMLRPEFLKGVEKLKDLDLAYDILIFPKHLDATLEFVKHFPEHKLVVDHLAKPVIGAEGPDSEWADKMAELASHKNVLCKLSGMVTECQSPWEKEWFLPFGKHILKIFGEDRVMYGSDWPVCKLMATYDDVVSIAESCLSELSAEGQAKVFGLNAQKFYGLK